MTTGADAGAAAAAVRAAARASVGLDLELAEHPEVSVRDGPGAYLCRVAGDVTGPWGGSLVVRVSPGRVPGDGGAASPTDATVLAGATVAREADWHALGTAHGLAVPAVLAEVPDDPGPAALVLAGRPERSLLECLSADPASAPGLAALMGKLHARVHALPVDGAPPPAGPGPLDALAELLVACGIAGGHFSAELENLRRDEPAEGPPVVCHGGFQLTAVRLEPEDPVGTATVANWSAASVGERERDVAHTMLAFWSLPYLAPGRARRQALRAVRDTLVAGYRAAYERRAPLDEARLRYWEAFHALSWSVRMAAGDGAPEADPWDPTAVITFRESYRKDLTRRFVGLTRGAR